MPSSNTRRSRFGDHSDALADRGQGVGRALERVEQDATVSTEQAGHDVRRMLPNAARELLAGEDHRVAEIQPTLPRSERLGKRLRRGDDAERVEETRQGRLPVALQEEQSTHLASQDGFCATTSERMPNDGTHASRTGASMRSSPTSAGPAEWGNQQKFRRSRILKPARENGSVYSARLGR